MAFSPQNRKGTISGILFVAIFSAAATYIAGLAPVQALGLSPLVIGIVMGIFYANTLHNQTPETWQSGITFSAKKILRFAIVFYGFRITFQQIGEVGMDGFLVSLIMLTSTLILGSWVGYKIFGMEKDTSILTASGAAVCGAAAVLATEPVLKSEEYKAAIAVSMVVLFGTISMFLYPVLYTTIFENATGFLHMTAREFGIYVGGTREVFLEYIKEKVDDLNIFLELGHTESIKSILMNRECLTCISKISVENELKEGKLFRVPVKDFECKRDFLMIYHKDKYHSTLFEKFVFFSRKLMTQMIDGGTYNTLSKPKNV